MSKRRIAKGVAIVIGAAWLLSGSACSGKKKGIPEASPYTVDQVREVFRRETGDELVVEDVARGAPVFGDATFLEVRPELDEKYGEFGITVFVELGRSKRDQFINSDPDENGIYWQYTPATEEGETSQWSAKRFYGNVLLVWLPESKKTNHQWERLDAALSRLSRE